MKHKDFTDASPFEFKALYALEWLTADDIQPVFDSWLSKDILGQAIQDLAWESCESIHDAGPTIQKAFDEAGVRGEFSREEAAWLSIRFYLKRISDNPVLYLENLSQIMGLRDSVNVHLFERPDCDRHFATRKKDFPYTGTRFAGQELAIENLVGWYYAPDDVPEWTEEHEERRREDVIRISKSLLETYYNPDGQLPDCLRAVATKLKTAGGLASG